MENGEWIGGNGTSEAGAGSDLSIIKTKIISEGNCYRLSGAKIFVTNGPVADIIIVYAIHENGLKNMNISAIIIEKSDTGYEVGQVWKKMGIRTSPISEIVLNECVVGKDRLLGKERFGLSYFSQTMLWERIIMAAYHIGSMELQFNKAFTYSKERTQFGKRIIENQHISDKLVKMRLNIENAKLLLFQTCWKYDNNTVTIADASMLKLFTSESKVENSLNAVQIFGGYGFMKESLAEKQLRDSIAAKIYSGTSEIQKKIISENLGILNE